MAQIETAAPGIPPQNLEAEESVLGAMMVSQSTIEPVLLDVRLQTEDFYRDRHRVIYEAIRGLHEDGDPVDVLTVTEKLSVGGRLEQAGGKDAVASLAAKVPAPGSAKAYAQIVKQNSLMRRLDAAAKEIQQTVASRDGEPSEMVERAERLLFGVTHEDRAADFREIGEILADEIDKLEALATGKADVTGTPAGFRDLDTLTGGFQPGNLIVLAGRPAMGKSAAVCNIAENVAMKADKAVALFSLEMSEMELAHRFIASQARIAGDRLRKGRVASKDWPKVVSACNKLEAAPLWIDDSSDLGLLDLRAKARRLHAQEKGRGREGLGLVIVDYLQLMRADDPRANRVEQVAQFSRGLKILARELEVPVIGISQLSRAPEQRPDKRPILSDLRESGCLTGDSRVLLPSEGYVPISELTERSGFNVLALNPHTWKLERKPVSRAFATGRKRVYRLTTALGRTIRATGNHKFRVLEGWARLDQLSPGERIAQPRALPCCDRATMSEDELALLGLLIGDGCTLPRHAIQFTAKDEQTAELAVELAGRVFGARLAPRIEAERTWFQVYLASATRLARGKRNPVAKWLDSLDAFGLRSHEKRVPDEVFMQPHDLIAIFLRHLWATDGCVWLSRGKARSGPRIYYATSSRRLARDVQSLLLRLGINARVGSVAPDRGRGQFHVDVSGGREQRLFLEVVGGIGDQRRRDGAAILELLSERTVNTNRDVIPKSVWQGVVKPARLAAGITERGMQAGIGTSYCGSTLAKCNLGRERAARVAEVIDSDQLSRLARSDVYWDRIVSIEEDGVEEVFDLTVEGLHNFVADDIVVHNSIEQDADLVGFLYRDEYYNGDESEDPGIAELIIAKHRNGPIGTVRLAFLAHYPKFADPAREERPIEQRAGEGPPLQDLREAGPDGAGADGANGSGGAIDPGDLDDFGEDAAEDF